MITGLRPVDSPDGTTYVSFMKTILFVLPCLSLWLCLAGCNEPGSANATPPHTRIVFEPVVIVGHRSVRSEPGGVAARAAAARR